MTYFFSLVAILIFIMYSFLYIIDRLCVSMWVFHFWSPECEYSFQLGLHLLKVTCVICCFFWKIKSFHFTTFVFLSLSLGWRSRYVCGRSGSCGGGGNICKTPPPPQPSLQNWCGQGYVFWNGVLGHVVQKCLFLTWIHDKTLKTVLCWDVMMSVFCVQMAHAGFHEGFVCHSCCVRQVMQLSYVSSSGAQSFLSFESLGRLVETECTLKTLSLNVKFVWHLMGIISMNIYIYIHGAHSPWQASHSVLKGNTTEFQM